MSGRPEVLFPLFANIKTLPSGRPVVVGNIVSITIPKMHLSKLASVPGVVRVESAIPTMYAPPLHDTARQIQADQIWAPTNSHTGTMGEGITIADLESAWDIFHPDYFRPDGGYVLAKDTDGDGKIGAGDEIDLDGDNIFESTLSLFESGLEEGYQPDLVSICIQHNIIPICHLGLLPQTAAQKRLQATTIAEQKKLLDEAKNLEKNGAAMLIVECIPDDVTRELSQTLSIPVIGIAAGPHCDGQVQVITDVLGLSPKTFKHARPLMQLRNGLIKTYEKFHKYIKDKSLIS